MGVVIPDESARRRTAHEFVKVSLRQAILRGAIPSGTHLVQADVARDLQVSTTPVREAMRDLATEGLIQFDPHRGAVVRRLSHDELIDIYNVSRLLFPEAIRQAAEVITSATLKQARAVHNEMLAAHDPGRWADLNREFHALLIQDISSKRMIDILRQLRDLAAMYVGRAVARQAADKISTHRDHETFLRLLAARDADGVLELALRHMDERVAMFHLAGNFLDD